MIYAATKSAGLMAVESCRVECEGCGVRFFCKSYIQSMGLSLCRPALCPGTIDNEFRLKTAVSQTGGRDETKLPIKHAWEGLLLQQEAGEFISHSIAHS